MSAATHRLVWQAKLDLDTAEDVSPSSWSITHGLGKPAEGTFTEVAFGPDVNAELLMLPGTLEPHIVADQLVREVAAALYGTAYAFVYPPEQYDEAVARWALRRRELVVVTSLEVFA